MTRRTVIITGGGTGIGLAMAKKFSAAGDRVAVCSRKPENIERARSEIRGELLAGECDLREREQIRRFTAQVVERWERVDVLINNAGAGGRNPIDRDDDGFFEELMDTNVTGTFRFIQSVLPHMPAGNGRIINISSVLGKFGVPASSAYCASKHAVIGLTRALALELAPRRVTVNAICPGWVDTDMARQGMTEIGKVMGLTSDQFKEKALGNVPIKRFVEADEIAAMAFFLASAEAAAITGQAINVCGGQSFY
ncbi:MAG: SDR family oxidoreductase [Acidobacteria bacterium]|nr:SDR family oxidoreductase [Acidobacteriota bacterium]